MVVNGELVTTWKEAVLVYLEVLKLNFSGRTMRKTRHR